jgi:hypothetical protein
MSEPDFMPWPLWLRLIIMSAPNYYSGQKKYIQRKKYMQWDFQRKFKELRLS